MAADESHDDRTRSSVVLTAGTRISHYKIINKIGAGGMGEVYLAEDAQLDRHVVPRNESLEPGSESNTSCGLATRCSGHRLAHKYEGSQTI